VNIGFDFDGVFSNKGFRDFFIKKVLNTENNKFFIITSRDEIGEEIIKVVEESGIDIPRERMFAMGRFLNNGRIRNKAGFIRSKELPIDYFFDDDIQEIFEFQSVGEIQAFWVPSTNKDSLMFELDRQIFNAMII